MLVTLPDQIIPGTILHITDPFFHALILVLKHGNISVIQVQHPGYNHPGIGPSCSSSMTQYVRDHVGNASIFILVSSQVFQPFRIESGRIHIEAGCGRKNLCISRPSQSLIPLRTIGGYIQKIPLQSPDDVVLQLVDQRIRTGETARWLHIRMDHHSPDIFFL